MDNLLSKLDALLGETYKYLLDDGLASGQSAAVIDRLCAGLNECRQNLPADDWRQIVGPHCLQHRVRLLLHQDPYSLRAFEKPRGYAGDAVMLDYVYSGRPPHGTSAVGQNIFTAITDSPNGRSVVERRDRLALMIDQICEKTAKPNIFSLACGHLREAQRSHAVRNGGAGIFLAMDQDADSLAVVDKEQAQSGVRTVQASLSSLLRGKVALPKLDLFYSTGLFDYLSDKAAIKLIAAMYERLRPGGMLVVTNFTPQSHGRGYMEIFMDWQLIYRTEQQLRALGDEALATESCSRKLYLDHHHNIAYLEITKHEASLADL